MPTAPKSATLEVNVIPPKAPGTPSGVEMVAHGKQLLVLTPELAANLGLILIQVASTALERDRVGTVVGAPPTPLVTLQ